MQRGYLNQKARDPAQALADFRAAEATGKAPKSVVLDQAYASAANGDHPQAVTLLRSAIDRADAGELALDEHQRYNVRNAIANYSRVGRDRFGGFPWRAPGRNQCRRCGDQHAGRFGVQHAGGVLAATSVQ